MEDVISNPAILGDKVRLLTKKEMAAEMGVSYRTIERWYASGYINRIRIGGRIFFSYSEVYRLRDQFVTGNAHGSYLEPIQQTIGELRQRNEQGFGFRR